MPTYKDTNIKVKSPYIQIHNPDLSAHPGAKPFIEFQRILSQEVSGEKLEKQIAPCRLFYTQQSAEATFQEINPLTDEPTEVEYTYDDFYKICYSLFCHATKTQDNIEITAEAAAQAMLASGQQPST